jgi:hypothetical protein
MCVQLGLSPNDSAGSESPLDRHQCRLASSRRPLQPRDLRNPPRAIRNKTCACACACAVTSLQVMRRGQSTMPWGVWLVQTPSPLGLRFVRQTRQGCVSNHDDTKFTSNSACVVGNNRNLPAPAKKTRGKEGPGQSSVLANGARTTADRCATIRVGCTQQSIEASRPRDTACNIMSTTFVVAANSPMISSQAMNNTPTCPDMSVADTITANIRVCFLETGTLATSTTPMSQ